MKITYTTEQLDELANLTTSLNEITDNIRKQIIEMGIDFVKQQEEVDDTKDKAVYSNQFFQGSSTLHPYLHAELVEIGMTKEYQGYYRTVLNRTSFDSEDAILECKEEAKEHFDSLTVEEKIKAYTYAIIDWNQARGLYTASIKDQFLKFVEELSEFIGAILNTEALDAVGDIFVVAIGMALIEGISDEDILGKVTENRYVRHSSLGYLDFNAFILKELGSIARKIARGKELTKHDMFRLPQEVVLNFAEDNKYQETVLLALEQAYGDIRFRTGKMVDGVFVKKSDLE